MVKSIFLQDGEEIFVDDEDYERVSQHTWTKVHRGNFRRIITTVEGKTYGLAKFLLKGSYQKDKNNYFTKDNLTTAGNSQRWLKAQHKNTSKYKGVSWVKKENKWYAKITVDGKIKYLGLYANEDDAGRAYNQAVLDYWDGGGFINVIGEDNRKYPKEYKTYNNQHRQRHGSSDFKGVCISNDKITGSINYKGKFYLGVFPTTHHAALAYNKCAIYLHGDDAILNNVPMTDELKEFISNWEIPQKILDLKK